MERLMKIFTKLALLVWVVAFSNIGLFAQNTNILSTTNNAGNGSWNSTQTWVGNTIPQGSGFNAVIRRAVNIPANANDWTVDTIFIEVNGSLNFPNGNERTVNAVVIVNGGTINAGNNQNGTIINGPIAVNSGSVNLNNSTTNGDIIVNGGSVSGSGPVNGNVTINNGTYQGTGNISGNVEVNGGLYQSNANIGGNVSVTDGTFISSGNIGGDFDLTGGTSITSGNINGNVNVSDGTFVGSGNINGDVTYTGGSYSGSGVISGNVFTNNPNAFNNQNCPAPCQVNPLPPTNVITFTENTSLTENIDISSNDGIINIPEGITLSTNGNRFLGVVEVNLDGVIEIDNEGGFFGANAAFNGSPEINIGPSAEVRYIRNTGSQIISALGYQNLTLTGNALKNSAGDLTVNGTLFLAENPNANRGQLELVNDYANYASINDNSNNSAHNQLLSDTLFMGPTATFAGPGDVTGIIKRNTIQPNIEYTFGSPFTSISFNNEGAAPSQIIFYVTIGNRGLHVSKSNAVRRLYQVLKVGGESPNKFSLKLKYGNELNGLDEDVIELWDHHIPYNGVTPHEHGFTERNTTNNWVQLANQDIQYIANITPNFTKYWMIAEPQNPDVFVWLGAGLGANANNWNFPSNWNRGRVPDGSPEGVVIIPNGGFSAAQPSLEGQIEVHTVEIQSGATINAGNAQIRVSGNSWINEGEFNAENSTVIFESEAISIQGNTVFNNLIFEPISGLVSIQNDGLDENRTTAGRSSHVHLPELIVLKGDMELNTPVDFEGNTTAFEGSNPKKIKGSFAPTFNNLTINEQAEVELENDVNVSGNLVLQNESKLNIKDKALTINGQVQYLDESSALVGDLDASLIIDSNQDVTLKFSQSHPNESNRLKILEVLSENQKAVLASSLVVEETLLIQQNSKLELNQYKLKIRGAFAGNGSLIGNPQAVIEISGNQADAGQLRMDQTSNESRSLDTLVINKQAGAVGLANQLRVVSELKVSNGNLNTGGNLLLTSNADKTARIAPVNGTISGDVNQQRFINFPTNQWFELGSPVNMTLAGWQNSGLIFTGFPGSQFPNFPTNNAYRYNTSLLNSGLHEGWGDGSGTDNTQATNITNAVNRGQAWKIFGAAGNFTLNNIGEPASGAIQVDLVHNTSIAADQSWNFVSNPYCSPVNWEEVTRNNVHNTYYIYRRTGPNSYQYATYQVGGANTMGQTENIGIGQGFWVRTTGANPNLTFNQNDKTAADPGFVRDQMLTEHSILKLSIRNSSNNFLDETAIVFNPNAQEGDDSYDAVKLYSNDSPAPSIAQINSDNSALVFNHLPKDEMGAYHIPLEVKINQNGTYIFSIPDMQNLDDFNHCMYFFDSQTQEYMALDEFFEYGIPLTVGSYTERFYITISRGFTYQNTNVSCFGSNDASITFDVFDNVNISFSSANEVIDVFNQFNIVNNLQAGAYTLRVLEGSSCAVGFEHEIIIESPEEVIANFTADRSNINLDEESETGIVHFQNLSEGANNFQWIVTENGSQTVYYDEEISHTFTQIGVHSVFLNISNGNVAEGCVDSFEMLVTVSGSTVGINSIDLPKGMRLLTTSQGYQLAFDDNFGDRINLSLYSADGKLVWQNTVSGAAGSIAEVGTLGSAGMYILFLNDGKQFSSRIKISF
jgi:hypothetical protein